MNNKKKSGKLPNESREQPQFYNYFFPSTLTVKSYLSLAGTWKTE